MKKISIITTTLNAELQISRLIACLRQQSCTNFEWIVADGGSTDGTLKLLGAVTDIDMVLDSRPDRGIYDAMNRALTMAKGDYYIVLGSDDIFYPDAVEAMSRELESDEFIDLVVFGVKFGKKVIPAFWRPGSAWFGHRHMVTSHSVGMLIRTSIHKTIGTYSLQLLVCADGLFIKRMAELSDLRVRISNCTIGEFGLTGVSNTSAARGLTEGYLIQLATERSKFFQTILFALRILKNIRRICVERVRL